MFKRYRARKALIQEEELSGSRTENKEYQMLLMELNITEVHLNDRIKDFARHRELLKIEAVNRNLMIKKLIDKVVEDLGAVSFILGSIKEIEIKTDFLIEE